MFGLLRLLFLVRLGGFILKGLKRPVPAVEVQDPVVRPQIDWEASKVSDHNLIGVDYKKPTATEDDFGQIVGSGGMGNWD